MSSKKRILVTEDEPAIGELCQRILTAEGFEVDIAVDGRVAQNFIKQNRYDAMLLDLKMPELDGKQLYAWLKQERYELAARVIITSGSVIMEDTLAFIESTGMPFLPKPFTRGDLTAIIRKIT